MYKRKRAGNTITRKINSTKDTAAKADKNHYISNSYLEGFIPIDTEYFTASNVLWQKEKYRQTQRLSAFPVFSLFFQAVETTELELSWNLSKTAQIGRFLKSCCILCCITPF